MDMEVPVENTTLVTDDLSSTSQQRSTQNQKATDQFSPAKRSVYNLENAGIYPQEPDEFQISINFTKWNMVWDYDLNCIRRSVDDKKKPANYGALFQESLQNHHPGLIYNTARQPRILLEAKRPNVPFAQFWGYCSKKPCQTKYKLCIKVMPHLNEVVTLTVIKTNPRNHPHQEDQQTISRKIKGPIRQLFAKEIGTSAPSTFESHLYRTAEPWDLADNVRPIGLNVARKLKYEARQANFLSKEVMVDLDKRQQRLSVEYLELPAAGYLQEIGYLPFQLQMFNSMQLHTAIKLSRKRQGLEVHIDATGSILSKLDFFRHKVFLYTLVIEGPNSESTLPIFDFILDMHDWIQIRKRISGFLTCLNACQDNVGIEIRPIMRVITDFSWALIKANVSAFNNYMSVGTYLNIVYKKTFNIPDDTVHSSNFYRVQHLECIITLCYSHIMKSFSANLHRKSVTGACRQMALHCFADMIKSCSHDDFLKVFNNFIGIFGSRYDSDKVQTCIRSIKGDENFDMNEIIDEDRQAWYTEWETELVWEESPSKTKKPLKLFTAFYEDLTQQLESMQKSVNVPSSALAQNPFFSTTVLQTFFSIYVPVIPLWAEFCFKFHGPYTTTTNGRSEGMFSHYKTNVFQNSRMAPGELVETLFESTIGLYRKHYNFRIPKTVTKTRKKEHKPDSGPTRSGRSSPLETEMWAKKSRKKQPRYGSQYSVKSGESGNRNWTVLRGSFSQSNPSRFDKRQAGSQCTAIAGIAICYASVKPIANWQSSDLDTILTVGDQFYTSKLLSTYLPGHYFSADEIQGTINQDISCSFSPHKITLKIPDLSERSGMLLDGLKAFPGMKLLDVLLDEFVCSGETQCILTASGFSYAVMKYNRWIYFIDSHSRNAIGQPDAHGFSICIKMSDNTACDRISEILHSLAGNLGDVSCMTNAEVITKFGCSLTPFAVEISNWDDPPSSTTCTQDSFDDCDHNLTFPSLSSELSSELTCLVCNQPCGGAHKCLVCKLPVHSICGIGNENDEGFGELVTCFKCKNMEFQATSHCPVDYFVSMRSSESDMDEYVVNITPENLDSSMMDSCIVCSGDTDSRCFCCCCFKFCHQECGKIDDELLEFICRNCSSLVK